MCGVKNYSLACQILPQTSVLVNLTPEHPWGLHACNSSSE